MATHPALADLLCSALAEACNRAVPAVSPETTLLDLEMDSLTLISVLARLEAAYAMELTPEDTIALLDAACVADLIDRLKPLIEPR